MAQPSHPTVATQVRIVPFGKKLISNNGHSKCHYSLCGNAENDSSGFMISIEGNMVMKTLDDFFGEGQYGAVSEQLPALDKIENWTILVGRIVKVT